MFEDIFVFEKQRTPQEALGFYIVYVIMGVTMLMLFGVMFGFFFDAHNPELFEKARRYGQITASSYAFFISLIVVHFKKAYNVKTILFIILSAVFGWFAIFFGLIPTAYLTTQPNNASTSN